MGFDRPLDFAAFTPEQHLSPPPATDNPPPTRASASPIMRFHLAPRPLLHLLTTILLAPTHIAANPRPAASLQAGFTYNELFARYDCSGEMCGWNNQLCCPQGQGCYTNALNQAACTVYGGGSSAAYAASSSYAGGGGYWQVYTTVYTVTDKEVVTSVYSTYVGGASVSAAASGAPRCNYALNESPCGYICCAGNQYCVKDGHCAAAAATETTTTTNVVVGATPGAPIRPNSSGVTYVTSTQTPTTTVGFVTPVATGANVTMTAMHSGGGGLSGGAIAGIVIGVLIGLAILGLICFYCCIKGLLDGCLALFGLGGRRRRRTTEIEEYERRSSHHGGGRTWYGASKPSRVERRESHTGRNLLGAGAGLAGLWAILGLKRQRKKRDEKYSEYSYSSDYYTSSSK